MCVSSRDRRHLAFLPPCSTYINKKSWLTLHYLAHLKLTFSFLVHIASLNPDKKAEKSYCQRLSTQILGAQAKTPATKYFLSGYANANTSSNETRNL